MEIQAPKKERKILKSIGRIAGVLAQELVLGLGRKYIGKMINKIKIPKKRETLSLFSYIKTKGGWKFNNSDTVIIQGATMPFDSITFNTAKDGTVGVGEVEYNDSQGSLIQGLKGGNVTNVIGQQLHQRVSNVTGSTLSKGTAVYLSRRINYRNKHIRINRRFCGLLISNSCRRININQATST